MIDPSLVDSSTVEPQATFPHVRIDDASVNIVVDPVPPVEPFASLLLTPSQRNDVSNSQHYSWITNDIPTTSRYLLRRGQHPSLSGLTL